MLLPRDTTRFTEVVGTTLDDLSDAPPELGLALVLAGQTPDVGIVLLLFIDLGLDLRGQVTLLAVLGDNLRGVSGICNGMKGQNIAVNVVAGLRDSTL